MKELIERFECFGVSEYECKAYVTLLKAPKATAPWVSKRSDVPISKIYEVLERLYHKGMVLMSPHTKPRMYKAMDPERVLDMIVSTKMDEMREAKEYILSEVEVDDSPEEDGTVWVIRGKRSVERLLNALLDGAEEDVVVKSTPKYSEDFREILRELDADTDLTRSGLAANMISVDGRDMVLFSTKEEAVWIRDPMYTTSVDPSDIGLS